MSVYAEDLVADHGTRQCLFDLGRLATTAGPLLLCLSPHRWRRLSQAERERQAEAVVAVLKIACGLTNSAGVALAMNCLLHGRPLPWAGCFDRRNAEAHLRAAGLRPTRRALLAAARKAVAR